MAPPEPAPSTIKLLTKVHVFIVTTELSSAEIAPPSKRLLLPSNRQPEMVTLLSASSRPARMFVRPWEGISVGAGHGKGAVDIYGMRVGGCDVTMLVVGV